MGERCTGACCRAFPLHNTVRFYAHDDVELIRRWSLDGEAIADMIVPLVGVQDVHGHALWTCRHFDGSDCAIYEKRPQMCADHGVSSPCSHVECTLIPEQSLVRRVEQLS